MSARAVALSDLIGRPVRDSDGRRIGRIEELEAEIELHPPGNDYVVTRFDVGRLGPLDALASGRFMRQLLRCVTRAAGDVRYEIPWGLMDLRDPAHPRALRPERELPRAG
jgi:hypothetical protein